jgi:ATP-binding protein involved in chromosome partitioning
MSNLNQENIRKAIDSITDPDLGQTLGELNSISDIEITGNNVKIVLNLVAPAHNVKDEIIEKCKEKLKDLNSGTITDVSVTENYPDPKEREFLKGVKNIIAVASGKGGVGKSAIASNIAAALAQSGARTGLLDGDVYGPSQPVMYGMKDNKLVAHETEDGKTVAYPNEKYGVRIASMGFIMNRDDAAIVRGPMLAGYFSMLFEQIDWGELDYLVFDLPPGTGDIQLTLTQKIPLTGSVIVTTPQEISLSDVRRSISMFNRVNVDILGIVENMSYFTPPEMPDKKYYIFGKGGGRAVADETGVDLLGEVPLDIDMREGNDGGTPVVLSEKSERQASVLKDITKRIVSQVRKTNATQIKSGDVEINI